jgi:hypothetical protein
VLVTYQVFGVKDEQPCLKELPCAHGSYLRVHTKTVHHPQQHHIKCDKKQTLTTFYVSDYNKIKQENATQQTAHT